MLAYYSDLVTEENNICMSEYSSLMKQKQSVLYENSQRTKINMHNIEPVLVSKEE